MVNCSINQLKAQNVIVSGALSGNGSYPTLRTAFAAVNGGTQLGANIVIDIVGNATETGTAILNNGAWSTMTIQPSGGVSRTITGNLAFPLVDFSGADNVTINGLNTGGNSLTISNTNTGATAGTSTIRFINDASNNTITNCTISGSSTGIMADATGTILFSTGTSAGNDNNTISANNIGPAGSNLPSKAIMASGTSATIENDNIQITGNNIFDFFLPTNNCSGINILTGNDGCIISLNKFYQTGTRTFTVADMRYCAITFNNTTGNYTATNNTIGFASSGGTGTTTITGSSNEFRGISSLASNTGLFNTIQYNHISGINQTTSNW